MNLVRRRMYVGVFFVIFCNIYQAAVAACLPPRLPTAPVYKHPRYKEWKRRRLAQGLHGLGTTQATIDYKPWITTFQLLSSTYYLLGKRGPCVHCAQLNVLTPCAHLMPFRAKYLPSEFATSDLQRVRAKDSVRFYVALGLN